MWKFGEFPSLGYSRGTGTTGSLTHPSTEFPQVFVPFVSDGASGWMNNKLWSPSWAGVGNISCVLFTEATPVYIEASLGIIGVSWVALFLP